MELVVKMIFGAPLYGIATEASDLDYRGVFMPSPEEIRLGNVPKCRHFTTGDNASKNKPGDVDEEIYSFGHFIKMACRGEIAAMDMLHAPQDFLLVTSDLWHRITAQRQRFYTKKLRAFIPYILRQTGKYGIKGSRLHAAASVLELLKTKDPRLRLRQVWDELPRIQHCRETERDPSGTRRFMVCGKTFQASVAIGHVIPILEKFYDDFGRRARLAADNRGIDWKAVSHAFRAALQTREILTTRTLKFPLHDAPFLTRVKQGRLDYPTEAAPALEALMEEVEQLLDQSALPEQVSGPLAFENALNKS